MLNSLRGRLIGLLLLVFVPAAVLMIVTHFQQRDFVAVEIEKTARRITRLVLQKEEAIVRGAHALVIAMANAGPVAMRDQRECERHLRKLLRFQPAYVNLGYVNAKGDLICSALPPSGKSKFADRPWFTDARDQNHFIVVDYIVSHINGDRAIAHAYPIRGSNDQFNGVAYAVTNFSWLKETVALLEVAPDSIAEVVDLRGMVLARYPQPADAAPAQPVESAPILETLRQRHPAQGVVQVRDADGRRRTYGFAPLAVASQDLYVLIGLPSDDAFHILNRGLWHNLIWLAALAAIGMAGVWLAVDAMILRGVRQLIGFSRRLASGEFSARNDTGKGIQELDHLSDAFDQMAVELERRENDRLRTGQALRASEERFRSMAESSSVGIFRTDAAGLCIYVNRQWCQITGMSPEQAYGDGWISVLHPIDRARVAGRWKQAVNRRQRFRDEYRFVLPGGIETWVMGEAVPENEREGGFVGTLTDISERVQAETRLRTSEERFRVFMNNNPAACWIGDEHARYIYLNKALAEMLDGSETSLTGQSLFDLYPKELAKQYDDNNKVVLKEGRVLETVEQAPRRDGTLGNFATFRFPLRDSSGRDVVGGMAIDVTERTRMAEALRTSEERFREFMDNNPALCWISDESGRITYVNKTYLQSLKLPFDPVGRHPIEVFSTSASRQHIYGVKAVLTKDQAIETQEQFARTDNSRGDFTVFRFPLIGTDGRRFVGGVAIDITERRRAADDLKEANLRLQGLSSRILEVQETERRQLARELHDEIGQCLTALKINLEGLQRTTREPAVLARVAESVELSAHTLAQVRRLSIDLRPSQLDDLGLEPAIRSILARQAATGGFASHFDSNLGNAELSGQIETACFRVCQEALTNIVKHAEAQNVWVTIETQGNKLQLRVRDDGKGFDPMTGNRGAIAGESFGLLGMQERAMLAGGRLEIHSVPGAGSEVRAWFLINAHLTDVKS